MLTFFANHQGDAKFVISDREECHVTNVTVRYDINSSRKVNLKRLSEFKQGCIVDVKWIFIVNGQGDDSQIENVI